MNLDHVKEGCLSDLALDRLLAGELDETHEGWLAVAHLHACERCAARKASFAEEAESFGAEIFVQGLAAQASRAARGPTPWRSWAGGFAAAAAAAVLLVVALPQEDGVRIKGGGALELIARRGDGTVTRVLPGDELRPGDDIRFEVRAGREAWVAVIGLDAAQAVTPYVAGERISSGTEVLPGAIRLDETLGAERIVALFCSDALPTGELVGAGRRALALAGGDPAAVDSLDAEGCVQSSVLIRKVE